MQSESPKPSITHREVSWHANVAAIRAHRNASAKSTSTEVRDALILAAAMEPATEATPHPLRPPITLGTLWAIEVSSEHEAALAISTRSEDQALWALTLTQPERVLLSLLSKDYEDIRAGMLELSALPAADYYALDHWYSSQMEQLKIISGGGATETPEGKPEAEPLPSSATAETP
jgi:hypothetical protein